MKNYTQVKTYVVSTTWKKGKVFADYQDAWTYANKVYEDTGIVVAIENVYHAN
jgi:hypothetical protein